MPRAEWPLQHGRPIVEVSLAPAQEGQRLVRRLLADTGAGDARSGFELLLSEHDCLSCGGIPLKAIVLGGAYVGSYSVYLLDVQIPELGFKKAIPAVAVPSPPSGFDGIACFRFLNRWTYGNFGERTHFSLEI